MTITVNGKEIETFNFSGGECHVSIGRIGIGPSTQIHAVLYNADDIMRLLMTVNAVRQASSQTEIDLVLPYLPYARQDRVCNPGEAFGASVMCKLINNLNCRSVRVLDMHSFVSFDLLDNVHEITQEELLEGSAIEKLIIGSDAALVYPDKGAEVRVREVAAALAGKGVTREIIPCSKIRDPKTGHITDSKVEGDVKGKDCIIIDDICDGGRTFIELAKILKDQGAGELYLCVSHGIFSKGLDVLKGHFKHVYCYHSFLSEDDLDTEFLTVMEGVE